MATAIHNQLEAEIIPAADPIQADILSCLLMVGNSAWESDNWIASRRAYRLAHELDCFNIEALTRLGRLALIAKDVDEAIDLFSTAYIWKEDAATAINLAICYGKRKDFAQALKHSASAHVLNPKFQPAFIQQAAIYEEIGQLQDAEDVVRRGLELFPEDSQLLHALSLYQLQRGDYAEGWRNHEHRCPRLDIASKLDEYAEWNAEPLCEPAINPDGAGAGRAAKPKTILVVGEQGIGDEIQFARYLPLLAELGGKVVFRTRPELARLFAAAFPQVTLATSDRELIGIEPDYWVALCSLPLKLGRPENASLRSYLAPLPADIDRFAALIPNDGRLRVGLCWAGNPEHRRDEYRSMRYAALGPILDVEGCAFYSLQAGPAAAENDGRCVGLVKYCHDVADTAAAIANLDLVITVDTLVAHLAGAMGKAVWMLHAQPGDWRWGLQAQRTPWYPSAWLFRQAESGNWAPVVDQIAFDLRAVRADHFHQAVCACDAVSEARKRKLRPTLLHLKLLPEASTLEGLDEIECERDSDYAHNREHVSDSGASSGRIAAAVHAGRGSEHCAEDRAGSAGFIRSVSAQVVTKACRYGEMSFHRNDTYIGRALDLYGEYSEAEVALFRRILKAGDVVVEAGANIGALTLPLFEIVGFETIYPFEPQPAYADLALKNFGKISRQALGAECKKITIKAIPLDRIHAPGWKGKGADIEVDQITVDSLALGRLDLLKVDVDGQEQEIIDGASQTIERCRPLIYVENDKMAEYPGLLTGLHARGYRLYQHFAPLFNPDNFAGNPVNVFGNLVSAMVLAVPTERKDLRFEDLQRIRFENS